MGVAAILRNLLVKPIDPQASALYATCIAVARQPVFYASYGVPDTVDGRFDLLLLHVILVMGRLANNDAKQRLFDLMFADMDRNLREMGVGDMSIGKKMKPMLAGFYGRAKAYGKALSQHDDEQLIATLSRNLYGLRLGCAEHAPAIARYIRAAVAQLKTRSDADIAKGRLIFPGIV